VAKKIVWVLAVVVAALASISASAQQTDQGQQTAPAQQTNPAQQASPPQQVNPPQPPPQAGYARPGYSQGPPANQPMTAAPPGSVGAQPAYVPPAGAPAVPGNVQRPNYLPQTNYAQQPAYPQQQAYPQQPPGYQQPQGYPQQSTYPQQQGYSQQPAGYSQQPAGYSQQPAGYSQQPAGYSQQPAGYSQQPAPAQQPVYPQQAVYGQPPNYPQQQPGYAPASGYAPTPAYTPPASQGAVLPPGYAPAQPPTPQAQQHVSDQIAPYHVHRDTRYGHDRVYPDRGSVVRDAPRGSMMVNYAGFSYRFYDGVWYEPRGPAYIVVSPPIGLVVPSLPPFATSLTSGGETFFYLNDVYYRPRPDIGGYEVVNAVAETPGPAEVATAPQPYAPPNVPQGASGAIAPLAIPVGAAVTTASAAPGAAAAFTPAAAASTAPIVTASATPIPNASVAPVSATSPAPPAPTSKTLDEQARDRYECYRFAVTQTGFDPIRQPTGVPAADTAQRQSAYDRAQAACFEGRGYTIR
jgi:Family of unknown function (DUF6515)